MDVADFLQANMFRNRIVKHGGGFWGAGKCLQKWSAIKLSSRDIILSDQSMILGRWGERLSVFLRK